MKTLIKHNGIANPNSINVGQSLSIPGKSGGKAPQSSTRVSRTVPAAASRGRGGSHTIQRGETLTRIAKRYGVSVKDLQAWNGISDPSKLRVGQSLSIGGRSSAAGAEPQQTPEAVVPKATATLATVSSGAQTHVLQRGETLSAISRKHGVPVNRLMELNGISDPTRLAVGQKLILSRGVERDIRDEPQGNSFVQDEIPTPAPEPVVPKPPTTPVEAFKALVSTTPSQPYGQHTVRPGDTLHSISQENNVTVEALRAANGLGESNFIRDGQALKIPAEFSGRSMVADGREIHGERVPTSYENARPVTKPLFEVPEVPAPKPPVERPRQSSNFFGFAPTPTADDGHLELLSYTVGASVNQPSVPGQVAVAEDINAVAESFSTTAEEIRRLNNLGPGEPLRIGEKISVPASGLFGH
ncbi:MAG: LysM peptidoglycan-binding domain-containing protein [Verrucomicrobiales bacterium]